MLSNVYKRRKGTDKKSRSTRLFLTVLLSVFACSFFLANPLYSSEDKISGRIENGYRILEIDLHRKTQHFKVYRGDYIKFQLPEKFNGQTAVFPTLKESKQITADLKTTSYFKMKKNGTFPFQIASLKGEVTVTEYQQASYKALSAGDADQFIKKNQPLILDVRTRREHAVGRLENSILIPVQELQYRISELDVHKNSAILIYCATGNRSTVASKILIDSGFKKILNLRSGIVDWYKKNYPVIR